MTTEVIKEKTILGAFAEAFKKYFQFSGRSSRYDYWSFMLVNTVIVTGFEVLELLSPLFLTPRIIYGLVVFIPAFAILSRRLHDIGKSFWLIFIIFMLMLLGSILLRIGSSILSIIGGLVVVAPIIYFLYLLCKKGDKDENNYGIMNEAEKYNIISKRLIFVYFAIILTAFIIGIIMGVMSSMN